RNGLEKFLLAPVAVPGSEVESAQATLGQNTAGWIVSLDFNGDGTKSFGEITAQMAAQTPDSPGNRFAIVLDGIVVSAPGVNEAIPGGQAQITGQFTQDEAQDLANVLKFGALPLTFEIAERNTISPTLGTDQLRAGLIAGALGLALVVIYLLLYYRALALVAVFSLVLAGLLVYAAVVILGDTLNFALTLAGVAGLIVAIGITADSFIVYFERIRDEVRDGRSLRTALESGWVRARRTIIAADFISLIAAVVLWVLSVGGVRGFAFTLGLTTVIDLLVVFLFTKPVVSLLARTKFFNSGSKWSGLSPERLGAKKLAIADRPGRSATQPAGRTAKEA
ncbi:MAG: protein translocase subunit SecD, partial [Actinomycetia bacterium]|nr:protein translocase subunit SecD [Actinomycetes bacterium]